MKGISMRRSAAIILAIIMALATQTAIAETKLIPGGMPVGVMIASDGAIVIGTSDLGDQASPARAAGIRAGDIIKSVNGKALEDSIELKQAAESGAPVELEAIRGNEKVSFTVEPAIDPSDGNYRLGIWIRDSAAGIGTLTYSTADKSTYGALGHGVTDSDTGIIFPVKTGGIYNSQITGVKKGMPGAPGELIGSAFSASDLIGQIEKNTDYGIFGQLLKPVSNELYPDGLYTASPEEVVEGPATILTSISGDDVREYDIEIVKRFDQSEPDTRSMIIKVTDPELIEATGGIVQGMSGSPIIQNGKIIGAVTHVYLNDPQQGYGVYIDWMLDAENG